MAKPAALPIVPWVRARNPAKIKLRGKGFMRQEANGAAGPRQAKSGSSDPAQVQDLVDNIEPTNCLGAFSHSTLVRPRTVPRTVALPRLIQESSQKAVAAEVTRL